MRTKMTKVLVLAVLLAGPAGAQQGMGLEAATPAEIAATPKAYTAFSGTTLPTQIDLSVGMPVPGDQGWQNSCVAWAVAYAARSYARFRQDGIPLNTAGQPNPTRVFSPSYVYNQLNGGQNRGIPFFGALNLLQTQGVATLQDMPYIQADLVTQPHAGARTAANQFRIQSFNRLDRIDPVLIKGQLSVGVPVVIGAVVTQGLQQLQAPYRWDHALPGGQGLHAMVVVGYDDSRSAFRVMNSWGSAWADRGFMWVDYNFFPQVVTEAYVIVDGSNNTIPPVPTPTPGPAPTPPPSPLSAIGFNLAFVNHNVPVSSPFHPPMPGVRFDGSLTVPAGVTGSLQIVVQFFFNAGTPMAPVKGPPVRGLAPQYALVDGSAATGTPQLPLGAAISTTWFALLPYNFLGVPRGFPGPLVTSHLVAEPVLYVNGVGIRSGGLIPFFVNL